MVRQLIPLKHLHYLLSIFLIAGIFFDATAQKRKKQKQQKVSNVITTAQSYLGTPYKWGGNTKSGIDCSGLIHHSYKTIGIKLPRTAKEQSKVGKRKGWEGIKPGDIVYFKFKSKKGKWWHSGMITSVSKEQIKFIHASSSRGVVESNLLSDYYRKNVKNFRRVIK
ncbi:MAG: C40 family peptidase [Bacteroidota bacterium]